MSRDMSRDKLDRYYTPRAAVMPIIDHLGLRPGEGRCAQTIWEPCAGQGHIADILTEQGHEVITNDLDRTAPTDHHCDVMELGAWHVRQWGGAPDLIVTNPPYKTPKVHVAQVVRHLLHLGAPTVAILARQGFLEACEDERKPSYRRDLMREEVGGMRLAEVIMMGRFNFRGEGTDNQPSVWAVWRRNWSAGTRLVWAGGDEQLGLFGGGEA